MFLLDIDGVLCDPQQPVSIAMKMMVNRLALHNLVYIVTGNSLTKSFDLLDDVVFDGVFCNNADELRTRRGRLVWTEGGLPPIPPRVENTLHMLLGLDDSHSGNRIEWRTPRMINFSKCGRWADRKTRSEADVSWRQDTINLIHMLYPEVEAVIGGSVSIDIFTRGADKSRAGLYINQFLKREFVFIGDKTSPGGNDYPLVEYCINNPQNISLTSVGADYTLMMLDKILRQVG